MIHTDGTPTIAWAEPVARPLDEPITVTLTRRQHATVIAALTLAAFDYHDPTMPLETLDVVAPGTAEVVRARLGEEHAGRRATSVPCRTAP